MKLAPHSKAVESWTSHPPLSRLSKEGVTMPPVEAAFRMKIDNADQGMKLGWCLLNEGAHGLLGVLWLLDSFC